MGLLNRLIDLLLRFWKHLEIQFTCRCQTLDDILYRIAVHSAVQVESQGGNLGVCEEERFHSTLAEVILDRDIV